MLLAQSTRKDSSGEGLIGLIDGAQAIIMTLLVIETPILIIELVEHSKDPQELFFNLTIDRRKWKKDSNEGSYETAQNFHY